MNRIHLAAFQAVAEAGSFVRGALVLEVGQPAVSSHVADLELALGTALFERLPRGVRLTEAGKTLLAYARQISSLEFQASQAIADLRGLKSGQLRLGASTTVGAYLLPTALSQFRRLYPGVAVSLAISNTEVVQEQLLKGELDVAVTEGFVEDPALSATIVFHDELQLIAPPGNPLLKQRKASIRDLAGQQLILREAGSGTRAVVEHELARKHINFKNAISIGSTEAIKQSVIAGLGVAFVSGLAVEIELNAGILAVVALEDLSLRRPLHLLSVKGRPPSASAREFTSLLQKHAATRHAAPQAKTQQR
jgi:DNA-binding transcriptional LysR family regulator